MTVYAIWCEMDISYIWYTRKIYRINDPDTIAREKNGIIYEWLPGRGWEIYGPVNEDWTYDGPEDRS